MSLHCLVYNSVANQKMTDKHLKSLLTKSRNNNDRRDITGLLLYLDPFFLQILEGDKIVVESLYRTIEADNRHHKVRVIYQQTVQFRSFPNWTMGFQRLNQQDIEKIDGFCDFWHRQTSDLLNGAEDENGLMLQKLLTMFKKETLF